MRDIRKLEADAAREIAAGNGLQKLSEDYERSCAMKVEVSVLKLVIILWTLTPI